MMWTLFWDRSSGGDQKLDWPIILIEASEEEAKSVFYARFGRNPKRVTCTCCGEDYAISSNESLRQLTGFHRGCQALETPTDSRGLSKRPDRHTPEGKYFHENYYQERGQVPEYGFVRSESSLREPYYTVEEYLSADHVHVIKADEISDEEKRLDVPDEGYIWV